jgi:hypothetical protein
MVDATTALAWLSTHGVGFAMEYAGQNEHDYRKFASTVKEGRIETVADHEVKDAGRGDLDL